jgi:hypothetical protein
MFLLKIKELYRKWKTAQFKSRCITNKLNILNHENPAVSSGRAMISMLNTSLK